MPTRIRYRQASTEEVQAERQGRRARAAAYAGCARRPGGRRPRDPPGHLVRQPLPGDAEAQGRGSSQGRGPLRSCVSTLFVVSAGGFLSFEGWVRFKYYFEIACSASFSAFWIRLMTIGVPAFSISCLSLRTRYTRPAHKLGGVDEIDTQIRKKIRVSIPSTPPSDARACGVRRLRGPGSMSRTRCRADPSSPPRALCQTPDIHGTECQCSYAHYVDCETPLYSK